MLEVNKQKFNLARLTDAQLTQLKETEKNINFGEQADEIYLLAITQKR